MNNTIELKEALISLNTEQLQEFNEATVLCTPEQKLQVVKEMSGLPDSWKFTPGALKRIVERSFTPNWYPGIVNTDGETTSLTESERAEATIEECRKQQYDACIHGGMSKELAEAMSGHTPNT